MHITVKATEYSEHSHAYADRRNKRKKIETEKITAGNIFHKRLYDYKCIKMLQLPPLN